MYEPKIEVVRASPMGAGVWNAEDGRYNDMERAILVRGFPMLGKRVRHTSGAVGVVVGPGHVSGRFPSVCVRTEDGDSCWALVDITLYDPEAERLRVATEAIVEYWRRTDDDEAEDIARAVLDAIKEADDGE